MHSLLESENYELVTAALQQYEGCPRAAKAAWLALRQHQGILLTKKILEKCGCVAVQTGDGPFKAPKKETQGA